MKYHKIQSVFKRDPDNKHKTFLHDEWSRPEFKYLANNLWRGTEKVDGTNIRVYWNPFGGLSFAGRTDNAQIPAPLVNALNGLFDYHLLAQHFHGTEVVLYGEGYGAGIQKGGGNYRSDVGFILFDVMVGSIFLRREDVIDVAGKLGVDVVPTLFRGTLREAVMKIEADKPLFSKVARDSTILPEGLILTPEVPMFDRCGNRIITKIKYSDFERI